MDEGKPEQNPFAAPQSGPEAAEMLLGDDQSFRVINKIVLCRSSVDFSDVCWLTGATEGLVGRQTSIARAAPPWLNSTFAIIMIVIGTAYYASSFLGIVFRPLLALFMPLVFANLVLQHWLGIKVKVVVGQSPYAKLCAKKAAAFPRWIIAYAVMLAFILVAVYLQFEGAFVWTIIIGVNLGVLSGLVYYFRHRPASFSVMAVYHSDGVFKLVGLRKEFLAAISHRQT